MGDIYNEYIYIDEYKPSERRKILIVFDDMITDMISNKKGNPSSAELFISGGKLNIFLLCIRQSCFKIPKFIIPNPPQYFILKIPSKRELKLIAIDHLSDIDFKSLIKIYKNVQQNHILHSQLYNFIIS